MTLSISFYNNIKYGKDDFLNRDKDFFGNGVVSATDFPATYPATPNMTLNIGKGVAWVDGYRIANDSTPATLTVPTAHATLPRIDIVQIGHDDTNSTYSLVVKQGVAQASPVEPGADANYIKLYAINVAAAATQITGANVTDKRTLVPLNVTGSQISFGGAVQNTDPAYLAVKNGTFVAAGTGISTTAGTNSETVALLAATASTLGGVKQGSGVTIAGDGTLTVTPYSPPATMAKTDTAQTWTAVQTFSAVPSFAAAQGTAPFSVTSTTNVPNLNASTLNGYTMNQNLRTTDFPTFNGATFTGNVTCTGTSTTSKVFASNGITGATAATRYAGGTASGAPTSGTFSLGDFIIDQTGAVWICTVAGTPGTWKSTTPSDLAKYDAAQTWTATQTFSTPPTFTQASGTAPFSVTSNTVVTNLNADKLDGLDSTAFLQSVPVATASTLGGVKQGSGVSIDAGGVLTVTPYSPPATMAKTDTAQTWTAVQTHSAQVASTVATGTAPFTVTSTTKVANLNVDQVDGFDFDQDVRTTASPSFVKATFTQASGTSPFTVTSPTVVTNLNADTTDGYHMDQDVRKAASPQFNGATIWNGGANPVAGTAPCVLMKNYSTQAGGQATFLSNWGGANYWGIGGVDSQNVKIGVADSTGSWVAGQTFKVNIAGDAFANTFSALGLTGATAAGRWVGNTASGAPTTGTFALGDHVIAQDGAIWICTVAGTPGTWVKSGAMPHFQARFAIFRAPGANKTTTSTSNAVLNDGTGSAAFKFNASEWGTANFVLDVALSVGNSSATAYAGLWDITAGASVAGTEVSTSVSGAGNTYSNILRSGVGALVDGHLYTMYYRTSNSTYNAAMSSADIIALF